jgi:hypothetical protein
VKHLHLLVRAIITGFGLRIGAEVGKFVAHRVLPSKESDQKKEGEEDEDDDSLGTVTADPPDLGGES